MGDSGGNVKYSRFRKNVENQGISNRYANVIINAKITVKKPYIYMAKQNTYINIKAHTNNLNK